MRRKSQLKIHKIVLAGVKGQLRILGLLIHVQARVPSVYTVSYDSVHTVCTGIGYVYRTSTHWYEAPQSADPAA